MHRSRAALIILAVIIAAGSALAGMGVAISRSRTIISGVKIGGVDVAGLTREQAESRLEDTADRMVRARVTLKAADVTTTASYLELGGTVDVDGGVDSALALGRTGGFIQKTAEIVSTRIHGREIPLRLAFDPRKASSYLHAAAKSLERTPVDAKPIVENGEVRIVPEKVGIKLDLDTTLARLSEAVGKGETTVELAAETAPPKVTAADLRDIDSVLGSYSTKYKRWQRDRTHNLRKACAALNGTIVKPGQLLSYNKVVGPRLKKLGYRNAPMFVDGEVEPGLGGGVCQVSTTLYNAALLANMKIVQRSPHSRPVAYAPVGRDATVAYPSVDFKFRNASQAPIYITASVGPTAVHISLLGKAVPGLEVSLVSAGHQVLGYAVKKTVDDKMKSTKPVVVKEGRSGHRVSIYRIVKSGGKTLRELVATSYYRPETRVVKLPPPPSTPADQSPAPAQPAAPVQQPSP